MKPAMYGDLVSWYRLLDPPADHADEAAAYERALVGAVRGSATTLLELGSGAGHNALHLKRRFRCTLADVAEPMLALSRELNPECEHVAGDMRTLRLGRTFDAVLVHDAVMYMATGGDLAAMAQTAFAHTRPGGAAVVAPDFTRETFRDAVDVIEADEGGRSLRALEWQWDPDPADTTVRVEYAFLLRDGPDVRSVHDRHVEGLFPRATWIGALQDAGYEVGEFARPIDEHTSDQVFICRRP